MMYWFIVRETRKYGIDPKLFSLIVEKESKGDHSALSDKGAIGVTQMTSIAAKDIGMEKDDLYDPEKNIMAGVKYFAKLMKKYNNNLKKALAAYNAGPNAVDK